MEQLQVRLSAEHVYTLPTVPDKKEIFFSKEKKEKQFWRRQKDYPQIFFDFIKGVTKEGADATIYDTDGVLISLSHDDTKELQRLLKREMERRRDGVWFMNFGEPTYLTGDHYFVLQWGQMHGFTNHFIRADTGEQHPDYGGNYGMYREFQRDLAYFIDLCRKDPNCGGGFIAKAKKTGVTQFKALCFLNQSTMKKQKRYGMMSKSHDDVKDTNMMLFQFALERMPSIMQPLIKSMSLSKVVFGKPKKSSLTGSRKQALSKNDNTGLQTYVEAVPTVEDGFDGPKMEEDWLDEFPKYKNPYPQAVFDKSQEATKLQHQIIGKQWITSYPPEDDSKGFFEARNIWNQSSMLTLNELGQTASGLYRHFISVLVASEGSFDIFGKADRYKAKSDNEARRKQKEGNRREVQKLKRQYPETEKECWESGGSGSTFDNIRIGQHESDLSDNEKQGAVYHYDYFLDWSNGRMVSPLMLTAVTPEQLSIGMSGRWRFYHKVTAEEVNVPFRIAQNFKNQYLPDENTIFCGAVDPTDYKEAKDVQEGSKNAIVIGCVNDVLRDTRHGYHCSNMVIAEYFDRPDDPDEFYEELVKAILFFGMYVLVEANKGWVVTRLKKDGLQNFLLVMDRKNGGIRPYREGDEKILINTTEDMINEYCRAISRYIRKTQLEGEIDNLLEIKSIRLLQQLMDFDPLKTKIYDLVVAFGYWRVAVEALAIIKENRRKERGMYDNDMMEGLLDKLLDF